MGYKQFGTTGENVFVLGLGTYGHGEAYGGITKKESFGIFRSIIENMPHYAKLFVDTAPRYGSGKVEEWIGQFLKELGEERFLVATKGGRHIEPGRVNEKDFSHAFLRYDLERSLQRLNVDRIFLYQLHNPNLKVIKEGSAFYLMEKLREEGKIRYYGVSIYEPEEGIAAINFCEQNGYNGLASIQIIYNLLNKKAEKRLFKKAKESEVAIVAREPLLRGFLTGKYNINHDFSNAPPAVKKEIDLYGKEQILSKIEEVRQIVKESRCSIDLSQIAIKFAISNPNITLAIPGINRIEYINPDMIAADIPIDDTFLSKLRNIEDLVEIC